MGKFRNLIGIGLSYTVSRVTGDVVHWGKPVSVSLEPVNRCNLGCTECPAGRHTLTRPRGTMSQALFNSALDQLLPELAYATLYFQGEPYLHPGFTEMAREAGKRGLYTASSTNGHFLDAESARETVHSGLDRLIVSIDGYDQESYAAYRAGGSLAKVVGGIKALAEAKRNMRSRKPYIVAQCLLLSTTQDRQEEVRKLAREAGADRVEFKTAQFCDFENGHPLMPEERYSRYRKDARTGRYVIKNPLRNGCFRMWSSCVITWDGLVVPCCYDKDAAHVMGDLNRQSFAEIWNGEKYREFRKKILHDRKSVDICQNCTQRF